MSAFQWLNELMAWLGRLVPRIELVRATHRAVLFGRNGRIVEIAPGLFWYWPIVTEVEQVCITERSTQISTTLVANKIQAVAVVWRIVQPVEVLRKYRDIGCRMDDAVQASLVDTECDVLQMKFKLEKLFGSMLFIVSVKKIHDGYGIPLKLFKDWSHHESSTLG